MPTKHLLIKGNVQGVFYRATAREMAEQLGITGWIRNTEEGEVEATVTGPEEKLNAFVRWCRQGPPKALVNAVEVRDEDEKSFPEFKILRGR